MPLAYLHTMWGGERRDDDRNPYSICCHERRVYPSDVTDAEWAILEPLIPAVKKGGTTGGN